MTPLHYSARGGLEYATKALCCAGADPNLGTIVGATPLHYAASEGHTAVVLALIEHGADVSLQTM